MQYAARPLGLKIKKLREEKNISREQMADVLGLSVRTYGKIEVGERDLHVNEAVAMAKKLDVEPEDLLYHEPKTIFEHCQNTNFYNQGTIQYQSLEELHCYYQQLLTTERDHHLLICREKDELIATQQKIIGQLQALTKWKYNI